MNNICIKNIITESNLNKIIYYLLFTLKTLHYIYVIKVIIHIFLSI